MPTISRLFAAVIFAVTAYIAGEAFKQGMPEGTQFGQYSAICVAIGLFCGWSVMGKLTGRGYRVAAGSGLRTSVTLTVWALLIFSVVLMVRKAFKKRYESPLEAIVDIFARAVEHSLMLLTPEVLGALILGGILGGFGAEWAKRRWD